MSKKADSSPKLKDAEREEVRRIAADDYSSARDTLIPTHASKAVDYEIYRGYRDDASGGVGNLQHLVDGITQGHADAVLAASIFHYGQHTVQEAKAFMAGQGIPMRLA